MWCKFFGKYTLFFRNCRASEKADLSGVPFRAKIIKQKPISISFFRFFVTFVEQFSSQSMIPDRQIRTASAPPVSNEDLRGSTARTEKASREKGGGTRCSRSGSPQAHRFATSGQSYDGRRMSFRLRMACGVRFRFRPLQFFNTITKSSPCKQTIYTAAPTRRPK